MMIILMQKVRKSTKVLILTRLCRVHLDHAQQSNRTTLHSYLDPRACGADLNADAWSDGSASVEMAAIRSQL